MPAYTFTVYIFFQNMFQLIVPLIFSCSNQNNQAQHQQLKKHTAEGRHEAPQWQMQLHQMQDKSKQPPNLLVVAV
jgi:hypothetical protein